MSLFNILSRFVKAFLPRSKHLLISWLQSPSTVILEPKKISKGVEFLYAKLTCIQLKILYKMFYVSFMVITKQKAITDKRKRKGTKSLLMRVKEESKKAGLKLNIQKSKIVASGPITVANRWENNENRERLYFLGLQNHCEQ